MVGVAREEEKNNWISTLREGLVVIRGGCSKRTCRDIEFETLYRASYYLSLHNCVPQLSVILYDELQVLAWTAENEAAFQDAVTAIADVVMFPTLQNKFKFQIHGLANELWIERELRCTWAALKPLAGRLPFELVKLIFRSYVRAIREP